MSPIILFWIVFSFLLFVMVFISLKYNMLNDSSILTADKPYSFSRTQLAWWTLIILSSFVTIILSNKNHDAPQFNRSIIILLGISAGTLASARITEISEQKNGALVSAAFSQNQVSESFLLDILSDKTGVSIHRLQTVIFNMVFGSWFIYKVITNLVLASDVNMIMPEISDNNLILLGISTGTYIALKTGENKS
jgi:hypothetical protein